MMPNLLVSVGRDKPQHCAGTSSVPFSFFQKECHTPCISRAAGLGGASLPSRGPARCQNQAPLETDMGLANAHTPLFAFRSQDRREALRRFSFGCRRLGAE